NRRYTSRFGQPADPTAWTTYEALRILQQAAQRAGSDDPRALAAELASGEPFTTTKGALAFDESHQLARQTLYVAAIDPRAAWGPTLSEQVSAARLARTLVYEGPPPLPWADVGPPALRPVTHHARGRSPEGSGRPATGSRRHAGRQKRARRGGTPALALSSPACRRRSRAAGGRRGPRS